MGAEFEKLDPEERRELVVRVQRIAPLANGDPTATDSYRTFLAETQRLRSVS